MGFPATREAASKASTWIVYKLLVEVLEVSVVPTTPIVGVTTLVTVGGAEALKGSEVTTVWTDEPVIPMVGVDVVVVEVRVSPSR